jgi:hypothetical protein
MADQEVYESMMAVGRKYAAQALEAESNRTAKQCLDLATKAYGTALKAKMTDEELCLNSALVFLGLLDNSMPRAKLWLGYISFCEAYGFYPLSKTQLFDKLEVFNYKVKRRNSTIFVEPPRNKPTLLLNAAANFKKNSIDIPNQAVEQGNN